MIKLNGKDIKNIMKGGIYEKWNSIIWKSKIKLEVNMKDETVWLLLDQMAKLFGRDRTVITRHINIIFKDKELEKNMVHCLIKHKLEDLII